MKPKEYQQSSQTEGAAWLADNLEGSRRSGDGYIACCPAHDDQNPSLSINEDATGKVLLHCHAGCEQQEVIEALRVRGLWPVPSSPGHRTGSIAESGERLFVAPKSMRPPDFRKLCGREPDEIYFYRAAGGGLLGYVCRILVGGKKSFRPITAWRNLNGDPVWRVSDFAAPKPLFGLYDLAKRPDAPVLVVEGEKTADAAEDLFPEHVVISWPGGAKAVGHADWRPLQGRNVTIWPDADGPGRDAAIKVAEGLSAIGAASIKIAQLPADLPEGWDLADKIPASIKPEQVLGEAKSYRQKLVDYLLSARDLASMNLPPREMIIAPFLPVNSINLAYGPRGLGKTWVGLTIAKAVAAGEDWVGFEVPKRRRVLYVDGEMPLADLKQRLEAIGASRSNRIDILASEVLFQDLRPLNIHLDTDRQQITEMLFSLEQDGRRHALIIFDNLSALRAGVDENDNAAMDGLLRWFLLLRHRGYSILLIHHAGKGGDQRGGRDWRTSLIPRLSSTAPSTSKNQREHHSIWPSQRLAAPASSQRN